MFETLLRRFGHPKSVVVPAHHPVVAVVGSPDHHANTTVISHAPVHVSPFVPSAFGTTSGAARIPTPGPTIAVVNLSTVLTDAQVAQAVAAIQIQVDRDFGPAWSMPANLKFVSKTQTIDPTDWVLQVLDDSDHPGALGYHQLNATEMPLAKIFAKTDLDNNLAWSVTMSHEILEMIGDPYVDVSVFVQTTATTGYLFAFEMCDPVEDDSLGYTINDVLVSDFVLPAFYETGAPSGAKFDFCGHLNGPLTIGAGGYMSVFAVNPTTTGWSQQTGAQGVGKRLLLKGPQSRKARRTDRFKT